MKIAPQHKVLWDTDFANPTKTEFMIVHRGTLFTDMPPRTVGDTTDESPRYH